MMHTDLLLRGRHRCVGIILTPATVGSDEAKRRVLENWDDQSRLYALPDGRWMLTFGDARDLDSRTAPGVLVAEHGAGLATAPTLSPEGRELATWSGGVEQRILLDDLNSIDPSTWLTTSTPIEVLVMPVRPIPLTITEQPEATTPNLRKSAKVSKQSTEATRMMAELERKAQVERTKAARSRRSIAQSSVLSHTQRKDRKNRLGKLVMRTPASGVVGRRHRKYLEDLERKFTSGDFGEALRHALPIGGQGGGGLDLRVPTRRDELRLSGGSSGGGSTPYGMSIQQHLSKMYRQAAKELEENGRIDEAAFVLSELLNSPGETVLLLERHKRYRTAAELAEARELLPEIVIRLWWLAGDKVRAVALARKLSAFEQVIKQLDDKDPEAASQFRLLWVDVLEKSGNFHGAISVGWTDPQIRPLLLNPIRKGIAAGDDWALGLQAYLVALQPSEENRSAFIEALTDPDSNEHARVFAAQALVEAVGTDPVADRQVCSEALRALVENPVQTTSAFRSLEVIGQRADPLVKADTPKPVRSAKPSDTVVVPRLRPGVRSVGDVVALSNGTVLVALGEAGVRLVTADGRTAAEWSTPCHALVASDHDKGALVLTVRQGVVDVHILDLTSRKMRHYGPIETSLWAQSFDGGTWVSRDSNGRLAFYDMLTESPTVVWRELDEGSVCHALQRSPEALAAMVVLPPDPILRPNGLQQVWQWEMARRRLDDRSNITLPPDMSSFVMLASGDLIVSRGDLPAYVITQVKSRSTEDTRFMGTSPLVASEDLIGYSDPDGTVSIGTIDAQALPLIRWNVGHTPWAFRNQRNLISLWTSTGSIAVIDRNERRVTSVIATTE